MFDEFCFQFNKYKEDAGRAQKDNVREEHITMTDVENFPWLKKRRIEHAEKAHNKYKKLTAFEKKCAESLEEHELREIYEDVDSVRHAWALDHGEFEEELEHFRVQHEGGGWTQMHKKVAVNTARGMACSPEGTAFFEGVAIAKNV